MAHSEFVTVYVGLGANLGDAQAAVKRAVVELAKLPLTKLEACSQLYRSAPFEAQGPDFVNAVVQLQTRLNAFDLLLACQAIENRAGRERPYRNAPRTLDVDVLLYGSACIDSAFLTIPHPRMRDRAFVMLPLKEIAPELVTQDEIQQLMGQEMGLIGENKLT